ncbi:uncharacterized protein LOC130894532 [Diorhabda carinulata]|uniref:uncharacterized protein LOC130894532 n=1 Tax=Diorhabda carinulata TaxID=1163345 RepID=UPI0025A10CE8|nr:uncharacterized protein LOC130894532 [Diorhabda carinulata]
MTSIKPKVNILTHSEVHKKIIEHPPKIRPYEDQIGPYNRYNNENHEIYLKKLKQFEEARKNYNKMNEETLNSLKTRLHGYYMAALDLQFLNDETVETEENDVREENSNGVLVNKRTVRKARYVPTQDKQVSCNLELWFKRYLILNKFIWAVRLVIIKNRLLKSLEILKKLDRNVIKKYEIPAYFGSYKDIFEKFI